ncbi:class A rhodopsin-like G-protein coupled receptor GPRnna3, putative [Pediculus humanus corporis]|uniref:Class A rhodopsin-like G-protein coupled receptor GPRnna3, putative n=1 Tax=Pediculus humanus subsp. corporis TaxID=121224 RepID=E0VTL1_PEDHC|nr:class A rhodopsin-like G-protein coupled receptor GPRnna3, putative [Pediculus humanus corporis]EEB16738.1 class A rhodopsin-like G-protein coupled receptor GPRnna3, putative [Pediculus humanus corporis]
MAKDNNVTVDEESFNATTDFLPNQFSRFYQLTWEDLALATVLCIFIIITVVGNTLVILAVIVTKRLRTVTNCYVMSLAVADWLVGVFVMPPKVALHLMGSWELGEIFCDIWISLDVLCCTASILSLCAISVDRYLAVTQPLNYSRRRRSKKLALLMILIVWLVAIAITCPPIFGWYDVNHHKDKQCRYNQNEGYVIFSAMGSFFIPLIVMLYVYARISCVVSKRHEKLRQVENNSKTLNERSSRYAAILYRQTGRMRYEKRTNKFPGFFLKKKGEKVSFWKMNFFRLKNQKFISYNDESDYMERSFNDDDKCHHNPIMKSTSLSNSEHSQYTITSTTTTSGTHHHHHHHHNHNQRSIRSHYSYHNNQNNHSVSTELCSSSSSSHTTGKGNYYGNMNRTAGRPQGGITMDHLTQTGEQSCNLKYSSSSRVSSFRRESKTTQTLTIVVGGFVACWLPFFITYLMAPFLPDCTIPNLLWSLLTWLGWFNSAINPFIYAFYSVDFRTAFWRLTFQHCITTQKWQQQQFRNRNK